MSTTEPAWRIPSPSTRSSTSCSTPRALDQRLPSLVSTDPKEAEGPDEYPHSDIEEPSGFNEGPSDSQNLLCAFEDPSAVEAADQAGGTGEGAEEHVHVHDQIFADLMKSTTEIEAYEVALQRQESKESVDADIEDSEVFVGFGVERGGGGYLDLDGIGVNHSELPSLSTSRDSIPVSKQAAQILASMPPSTLAAFEKSVLGKYHKHGVFTTFKGRDQMKISQAKVVARREVEEVRRLMARKEGELMRLEEGLAGCRTHLSQSIAESTRLAAEILRFAASAPKPKLTNPTTLLPALHNKQRPRTPFNPDSPASFHPPTDPYLMQNRAYRSLLESFDFQRKIVLEASRTIPMLEAALIPAQQELAGFQLQETRLHEVEARILESDLKDALEGLVVEKYKAIEKRQRESKRRRAAEKEAARKEAERVEAEKKKAEREAVMMVKDVQMKARLNDTVQRIKGEESKKEAEFQQTIIKKKKALGDLDLKIIRIRKALNKTVQKRTYEKKQVLESMALEDIGYDLTETDAVRETRVLIKQRRIAAEKEAKAAEELKEKRKAEILQKLQKEEEKRKKIEKELKQVKTVNKALESLAPKPEHAFPFDCEAALQKAELRKKVRAKAAQVFSLEDILSQIPDDIVSLPRKSNSASSAASHTSSQPKEHKEKPTKPRLPPPRHKIPSTQPTSVSPTSALPASIMHPFTSNPPSILFKDYDPLKTYTSTITLTNTSCRVNTFRLLPLPVDLASYFEVLAAPPGRMSAGMTTEVKIIFRPPAGYDRDIQDGKVCFDAEFGGVFEVGVGCEARKCRPRVGGVGGKGVLTQKFAADESGLEEVEVEDVGGESEYVSGGLAGIVAKPVGKRRMLVDFGVCVSGDVVNRVVEIVNDGALPTEFQVTEVYEDIDGTLKEILSSEEPTDDSSESNNTTESIKNDRPLFKVAKNVSAHLKGYSSKTIHLSFSPPYSIPTPDPTGAELKIPPRQIPAKTLYKINFNFPGVQPLFIDCRARSVESPINIDRDKIDFNTCAIGCTYRERLQVRNRSNIALKFWVEIQGVDGSLSSLLAPRNAPATALSKITAMSQWGGDSLIVEDGLESSHAASAAEGQEESAIRFSESVQGSEGELKNAITIKPSGKRSDSLKADIPLIGEMEISPRLAFVQPHDSFTVWIKIKPSRSAWMMLKNGEEPFKLPIIIKYMNQGVVSPLPLKITGDLTTSDVSFVLPHSNGNEINFGSCSVYETKKLPVRLWNHSKFPQAVRFVSSHASVTIEYKPFEDLYGGLIPLPPMSQVTRYVKFEPSVPGETEVKLVCHTIWDRKYEIVCKGVGVIPALKLEHTEVMFAPTALGSTVAAKVNLIRERPEGQPWSTEVRNMPRKSVVKSNWVRRPGSKSPDREEGLDEKETDGTQDDRMSFSELYENTDVDLIGFEFGQPKMLNIMSRTELKKRNEDMQPVARRLMNDCRQDIIEAREAVRRADPSLDKVVKETPLNTSSAASGKIIRLHKLPDVFHTREVKVTDYRLMIPNSVSDVVTYNSDCLTSYTPQDSPPVSIHPAKGVLAPGASVAIDIRLSPTVINNLAVSKIINERIANAEAAEKAEREAEAAASAAAAAAKEEELRAAQSLSAKQRQSTTGGKKDKKAKEKEDKAASKTENVPEPQAKPKIEWKDLLAPHLNETSDSVEGKRTRPKVCDLYEAVDLTSVSVLVPCVTKRVNTEKLRSKMNGASVPTSASIMDTIYVKVVAPIVRPDFLIMEPVDLELNYGRVPVGQGLKKSFVIYNCSTEVISVDFSELENKSGYHLVNKIPSLQPGEFFEAQIQFSPTRSGKMVTKFELHTVTTHLGIQLLGEGIVPKIQISPTNRLLQLGDVPVGDTSTRTFTVTNTSPHPLTCHLRLSCVLPQNATPEPNPRPYGTVNFSGLNAFSVSPWHATIEAGATFEFTVKFSPDRESDLYYDNLLVEMWGSEQPYSLKLYGRCWDTSTALLGYDNPPESMRESSTALPPQFEFEWAQKVFNGEIKFETLASNPNIDVMGSAEDLFSGIESARLGTAGGGSDVKEKDKEKEKEKGKDKKKDAAAAGANAVSSLSEDTIADILRLTPRRHVRFAIISCTWSKNAETGKWRVNVPELSIANLKPASLVKPETKKPPNAEFTIEPYNGTFRYVTEACSYVALPLVDFKKDDSALKFNMEPSKGSLELGASKPVKVSLVSPVKEFWGAINKIRSTILKTIEEKDGKSAPQAAEEVLSSDDEFDAPINLESYFKVVLKGGLRLVEPKGVPGPTESRTWIVKVVAEVPPNN
ncbi:hypothetical protein HDV05_003955 [Chytridiales sp. JEL 0842]|nr:hypothetical protein HDV05_003955 [Chytridiales sp. JEL 0842]